VLRIGEGEEGMKGKVWLEICSRKERGSTDQGNRAGKERRERSVRMPGNDLTKGIELTNGPGVAPQMLGR
jgi:hypothetical protein